MAPRMFLLPVAFDPSGGWDQIKNWLPWERFIIQGFNYITRDKNMDKVVVTKIDVPEVAETGKVLAGKVYVDNLSKNLKEILVKIVLLSSNKEKLISKELTSSLNPQETKGLDFSFTPFVFLSRFQKAVVFRVGTAGLTGLTV